MSENRSVCAVVPAALLATANAAFAAIGDNEIGFTIVLSTTPDPNHPATGQHPGYGLLPATHYGVNDEGATDELIALWGDLKNGLVEERLPWVTWGENGVPTLAEATEAFAAVQYFQRISEDLTPQQHFYAVICSDSGLGAKPIWEDI